MNHDECDPSHFAHPCSHCPALGVSTSLISSLSPTYNSSAAQESRDRVGLGLGEGKNKHGDDIHFGPCPMAGKRAVVLARGGDFEKVCLEMGETCLVEVLELCPDGLPPEDLGEIVAQGQKD